MVTTQAMRHLTVGSVMHLGVVECDPQTPLSEVARMMAEENTHSVVVHRPGGMPEQQPSGVLSDLDLMRALSAKSPDDQASDAVTSETATVAPRDSLERAAQLMGTHNCSHLIVTDPDSQRPVGVISSLDVIRGLAWGRRPRAQIID